MNSRMLTLSAAIVAALTATAVPEVTNVTMSQDIGRLVTVTYHLAGAPAIVTMDVVTNGVSIGDENVYRLSPPSGAVSKLIAEDGDYTITWKADRAWPDHKITDKSAQVVVTAWDPAEPPDYMVVDLLVNSNVTYYTSAKALPGGLLDVDDYRTSKMVMRHIHAAGVEWTMGSVGEAGRTADNEMPHRVCLDRDYYMAVFPVTQAQFVNAGGPRTIFGFKNEGYWAKRIGDGITYNSARVNISANTDNASTHYPAAPGADSLIGRLRRSTGVLFDLPGEAQWEFAARAGHGEGKWGDGSPFLNTRDNVPGRCAGSSEVTADTAATCDDTVGTPTAGSYAANDFGLYDMNGGIHEYCLDWYQADITGLNGVINANGATYADGTGTPTTRVLRGGNWYRPISYTRMAHRIGMGANDPGNVGGGANIRGVRLAAAIPAEQ